MRAIDLLRELEVFINKIEAQGQEVDNNSSTSFYINELANILSKYEDKDN